MFPKEREKFVVTESLFDRKKYSLKERILHGHLTETIWTKFLCLKEFLTEAFVVKNFHM